MSDKSKDARQDLQLIQSFTSKISTKLSKNSEFSLDDLENDELQDIGKLLQIAKFLVVKYEDKKEMSKIMHDFVEMIEAYSQSIENIDDDVTELVVSAQNSINRLRDVHTNISSKFDFDSKQAKESIIGANNLTNSSRDFNTSEYLQNPQEKTVQVI